MSARLVVLLALPGHQLLDLVGPLEVFHVAARCAAQQGLPPPYRTIVAGPGERVVSDGKVAIETTPLARVRGPIDTLVVPGGLEFATQRFAPETLRWSARRAARARRVVSICTGAFVLAALGLLDGRRVTTHWQSLAALRSRAPRATVEHDALYVKDGKFYTSAGISAGMDLALALVEEDLGHALAVEVARVLVMFLHRPGGQSQFSAALTAAAPGRDELRTVRARIVERPELDHRVPALARRAGMSHRNFVRVFTAETGETPARFVLRVRIERARQLLERTAHDIEEVARRCGFGSSETLRRQFQRALGVAPTAYRARFERRAAATP